MASPLVSIDTQHEDMIHDSQFDYYSKKLATCSSDRTIKIFELTGEIYHNSATLTGHEGPVWQVAWAHPKFGVVLASCSYDGSVIIHREVSQNSWSRIYEHKFHDASVNSISFAPHEYGLILACASSDGRVSILEYKNDNWYSLALLGFFT
jgi:protein transport protein SEC13